MGFDWVLHGREHATVTSPETQNHGIQSCIKISASVPVKSNISYIYIYIAL
jgi:hypothetical protein